MLAVMLALPVGAAAGPTRLLGPAVSASSGTPATTFTFSVTYRNREGSPPDYVRVVVAGRTSGMSGEGSTWKSGVRFVWSSTLPAGEHAVEFQAMDRERFTDAIAGPTVVVTVPPTPDPTSAPTPTASPQPTPTANPKPMPKPTPGPTAAPTARPTPAATTEPTARPTPTPAPTRTPEPSHPTPTGGVPTPDASAAATATVPAPTHANPGATRTPGPTDPPGSISGSPGQPIPSGTPAATTDPSASVPPSATPTEPPGADAPTGAGPSTGPATPSSPAGPAGAGLEPSLLGGWGDLTRALELLGVETGPAPVLRLMPALVGSAGGVTLMMGFLFFGKRRRDGEAPAPDEVLSAKAARGSEEPPGAALLTATATTPTPKAEGEMAMPRWRRPSLLEARKADPLRNVAPVERLSFDQGVVQLDEGRERRLIRYHVVELLDSPDELRSARIGSLTQGDEVALLERSGGYWRVLCPDGNEGWIHRMTLGDVVGARPSPSARETWGNPSRPGDQVDADVVAAFVAARGRA